MVALELIVISSAPYLTAGKNLLTWVKTHQDLEFTKVTALA